MHTHTSLVITEAPSIRNDSASWIIIKWNHHLHALHKQTHRIASTIIYGSPEPHTQKKKIKNNWLLLFCKRLTAYSGSKNEPK